MWQPFGALGIALAIAGCSVIYNPSNIGHGAADALSPPIDAPRVDAANRPDAEVILDGDPAMLALDSVFPMTILEGQGDGGSREALLVISGSFIGSDATVSLTPTAGSAMLSVDAAHVEIANDGHFIAVPVTSLVDASLHAADPPLPLTIAVTQLANGSPLTVMLTGQLTLTGLDELTAKEASVAPLYSKITLGATAWTGDAMSPVILRATSSIAIGDLTASGGDATAATPGLGGPGGCAGGNPGSTGGCGGFPGVGGGGTSGGGGGGAGFATAGSDGTGTGAGQAGSQAGQPQVLAFVGATSVTNRASGGGGGGATSGVSAGTGGAGGGGGGIVELVAGGLIQVASITANGGAGGAGQTGAVGGTGGGGGGGAGGVIVLRSAHAVVTVSGAISLAGGGGGAPGGSAGSGGSGSSGRFRWDQPTGSVLASAHRGPSFAVDTPQAFTEAAPAITVIGANSDGFDVYVRDASGTPVDGQPTGVVFGSGPLTIHPTLTRGYNHVCMTQRGGALGTELSDTCIDVAYLP